MELHAVILAGGKGERFWPLSRARTPKQLLRLSGEETLLGATLSRCAGRVAPERTWAILSADLRPAVERLRLPVLAERWLWEPVGRNTAAAIGAAVERILADGQDADVLALPSDHWVPEAERFWAAVETGREVLRRGLPVVTFGVRPGYAETGYGYVERGTPIDGCAGAFRAARFHEKPDAEQAERYVADGRCSWNSGIFLFRAGSMADLLRRHVVELAAPLDRLREAMQARRAAGAGMPSPEEWRRYFEDAPSVSIDHGVMERAAEVALVEAEFEWSDLGNWISLADKLRDDGGGNRARGETLALDSEGCVLFSDDGGLLAVLGVKDLIVVRAADATLVCPRDRAQEVRRLVRQGKADARLGRYF